MYHTICRTLLTALFVLSSFWFATVSHGQLTAVQLRLSWADNSTNEDGFRIERKVGTTGTFSVIATVGPNVTSYTDASLVSGTTYCYRVNAFNGAGNSPYSPEVCATTAMTTPPTTQQFQLAVTVVKTITTSGTGNGTVTSNPAGISCGSTCLASYNSGTTVVLTAMPAAGSTFGGWSGTGCTTGTVSMTTNRACTATFNPMTPQTYTLSVAKSGTGNGTVTSSLAGINCGSTCSASYAGGTVVALSAAPAAGSVFAGWSGTGCGATVTITSNLNCTATFQLQTASNSISTRIGVFRPQTGQWFLDKNGNGRWDGCAVDLCVSSFGQTGDLPVVGTWSAQGVSNIGTFNAASGNWQLDTNGNGQWDGCAVDTCVSSFGRPGDLPVTRRLSTDTASVIGTFTPSKKVQNNGQNVVQRGVWTFYNNTSEIFDTCVIDSCDSSGAQLPVVGDWNGTGSEQTGIFLATKGKWYLNSNGNGKWDGCLVDTCLRRFGAPGDIPVAGDWDGSGRVRIGVFRPSTAMWYLDLNGNGKLDACGVDLCLGPYGQPGDLPVVGKW